MYSCPSCRKPTISLIVKWWSCAAFPATCNRCGQASLVPSSKNTSTAVVLILFVALFGFISAAIRQAWPLAVAAVVAVSIHVWRWHRAALQKISPDQVDRARKESRIAFLIAVLAWWV